MRFNALKCRNLEQEEERADEKDARNENVLEKTSQIATQGVLVTLPRLP